MPHLLFDKSAFQALRDEVHEGVRATYQVITTPTLLTEIGGDLAVDRVFVGKTPEEKAQSLARKFGGRVEHHQNCQDLCRRDLFGDAVRMREGPITQRGSFGYVNKQLQEIMVDIDGELVSPQQHWVDAS